MENNENIEQNKVEAVAAILRSEEFNKALLKTQEITRIAQRLVEQNPELTPEEIGIKFDEEERAKLEAQTQKEQETQEIEDNERN